MKEETVEWYRHAVVMKSRAEDRWRTAVQHVDAYEAWYAWQHWKREVEKAYSKLDYHTECDIIIV